MATDRSTIEKAINTHDALTLEGAATVEQLTHLKVAEEVLALARERKKNTGAWAALSQALVGIVAAVGMLVNGYQSYTAKVQQQQQRQVDQERWNKEFDRAQRADKYRAFFETSVLATDPTNADKRLVGYALLQEFVDDEDYNSKATLMLEESLAQELRSNKDTGLDERHRNAVVAIVSALSEGANCHALERAARSIERIARRHAVAQDVDETGEIFRIYVRRLVGRATVACKTMKDFVAVRRPLVEALATLPEIVGAAAPLNATESATRVAQLLVDICREEMTTTGVGECQAMIEHYSALCGEAAAAVPREEGPACEVVRSAAAKLPRAAALPLPVP